MLSRSLSPPPDRLSGPGSGSRRACAWALGALLVAPMAQAADAASAAGFSADVAVAAALLLAALLGLLWWRIRAARSDRDNRARRSPGSRAVLRGDPGAAQRLQRGQGAGGPISRATAVKGAAPAAPPASAPLSGIARQAVSHAPADGIDLIQQAEFLSLLGERDAAVALLTAHLEGAGADDAAVWLKLLQVHRRFGDRHSFEQARPRYCRRFGIEAPTWAREPAPGTTLDAPAPEPPYDPDPGQTIPSVLLLDGAAARERGQAEKSPLPNR